MAARKISYTCRNQSRKRIPGHLCFRRSLVDESTMQLNTLANVAAAAVRRAQRHGFVLARDVRSELKLAGLDDGQWKEVIALAKPALHYRQGRYYPLAGVSPRLQQEHDHQRAIQKAVRR